MRIFIICLVLGSIGCSDKKDMQICSSVRTLAAAAEANASELTAQIAAWEKQPDDANKQRVSAACSKLAQSFGAVKAAVDPVISDLPKPAHDAYKGLDDMDLHCLPNHIHEAAMGDTKVWLDRGLQAVKTITESCKTAD